MKRIWVWMCRWNRTRGFGIHSPWAYSLVRYVINEHAPYYAYEELEQSADLSWLERKLGRLYFRLANWRQPHRVYCYQLQSECYVPYVHSGCRKTDVQLVTDAWVPDEGEIDMVLMSLTGHDEAFFQQVVTHADEKTLLVVEGIHENSSARKFWHHIQQHERTGITFDLYYCGLVFFDLNRYKEKYIINF